MRFKVVKNFFKLYDLKIYFNKKIRTSTLKNYTHSQQTYKTICEKISSIKRRKVLKSDLLLSTNIKV